MQMLPFAKKEEIKHACVCMCVLTLQKETQTDKAENNEVGYLQEMDGAG